MVFLPTLYNGLHQNNILFSFNTHTQTAFLLTFHIMHHFIHIATYLHRFNNKVYKGITSRINENILIFAAHSDCACALTIGAATPIPSEIYFYGRPFVVTLKHLARHLNGYTTCIYFTTSLLLFCHVRITQNRFGRADIKDHNLQPSGTNASSSRHFHTNF